MTTTTYQCAEPVRDCTLDRTYAVIVETAEEVISFSGYNHKLALDHDGRQTIRGMTAIVCERTQGSNPELREARVRVSVADTAIAKMGRVAAADEDRAACKAIWHTDIQATEGETRFEFAECYELDKLDRVDGVFKAATDSHRIPKAVGGGQLTLLTSAAARLRDGVRLAEGDQPECLLVRATAREHAAIQLAGLRVLS